jgi:tetratricopeptide (TPR) repeat protein
MVRCVVALSAALVLAGCAWIGDDDDGLRVRGPDVAEVVAELPDVAMPDVRLPPPSRAEVMTAYRAVYDSIPNAAQNYQVGKRLADLEMEGGVENDLEGREAPYQKAIGMYESLLLEADGAERDAILYQLARAHDVVGQQQAAAGYLDRLVEAHPDSEYIVEARFRRAEIAFSQDRYREAGSDYAFVVASGQDSIYWRNAMYMLGWCRFKTSDLDDSLVSFFQVVESVTDQEQQAALGGGEQELLDDALRVIVLGVAYLDGPETLAEHMDRLAKPSWQHRVYERLAGDYREKERYLDSVATLETFIARNSLDRRAPVFHQQVIEILLEGDFPSEIRARKEAFVARYGVRSEFWQVHDDTERADYLPALKGYLDELSALAHSGAQTSGANADYLKAADWYEQIVETFPEDPALAEQLFLLGEVYTEADEHARALPAYQRVMREFPDYPRANEAGYAVVLGLSTLLEDADEAELEIWQRVKIDAQIEFAMRFPDDERAPLVQADAADALFDLREFAQAVGLAEDLLRTRLAVDVATRRTALLIIGHGRFELSEYVAAEEAYRDLLTLPADPTGRVAASDINQRLFATIYKQAEAAESLGDADGAVVHFLRLHDEAPDSDLGIQGFYDAIAVVEGQQHWLRAAELLDEFRASYPEHELGADADKRLADLYERAEDWGRAADEFSRIAASDPDREVRRQALYRAAELYLDVQDVANAITSFEQYARGHPEPIAIQVEAIQHLDELFQQTGDQTRRRRWLRRKVELADQLGQQASQRLKFLAAEAQALFAGEERARFDALELEHPLEQHLAAKRDALKRCIAAFEKMAGYGVAQFATAATFEIADLYAALSRSLLESERPASLSDLELEQYEILLEEQAYPFEEQAIAIHEINVRRSWEGNYDASVQRSFAALSVLMPARFDKQELQVSYVDSIH